MLGVEELTGDRMKREAIFSASQPSTSKALSSSRRWLAFGMAASWCSRIEMRSISGVAVSLTDPVSVTQPVPTSDRSISTSKFEASTVTTLAIDRIDPVATNIDFTVSAVRGSTR